MKCLLILLQVGLTLAVPSANKTCNFPSPGTPTLVPVNDFNPDIDAADLFRAIDGWGTNEETIINILGKRSLNQRLEIAEYYKILFRQDLVTDLMDDMSDFLESELKDLLYNLMLPLPELYAVQLRDAIQLGLKRVMTEILATLEPCAIRLVAEVYNKRFSGNLEVDLRDVTEGNFERFIVSLASANRSEATEVDEEAAVADAQALLKAGNIRNDETLFDYIFLHRSYPQLRRIIEEVEKVTKTTIEKVLFTESSGDVEDGYLTIVKNLKNTSRFFADTLYESVDGWGTRNLTLIRIIVAHSETNLADIKDEYRRIYGKSLEEAVQGDTSGDYLELLMALMSNAI